jgi:hypothetical protein
MTYTIDNEKKMDLFNAVYNDYVKVKSGESWDIPNFYTIILYDRVDNKNKVLHIECEEDLDFFVKNFTYSDVVYIMQSPWRNRKDISTRYDTDCIVGVIYKEFLADFDDSSIKYFKAICKELGVDNYGEEDDPWEGRY